MPKRVKGNKKGQAKTLSLSKYAMQVYNGGLQNSNSAISPPFLAQKRLAFLTELLLLLLGLFLLFRRDDGRGNPAPHPTMDTSPALTSRFRIIMLAIHKKLHAHEAIEEEHAERTQEERDRATNPVKTIAAMGVSPAAAAVGREIGPGERVCEEGGGVKQVSAEGGHEEEGGEAGGALAGVVLV